MLKDTFNPEHAQRVVPSFEEEASTVGFYTAITPDNLTPDNRLANITVLRTTFDTPQVGKVYQFVC